MPKLSALYKLEGAESVIQFHSGLESLELAYLNMIRSVKIGEDYLVLGDMEAWSNLDRKFFNDFVEKRGKLDIKVRMILTPSKKGLERKGPLRKPNEKTRILPKGSFLTTNLVVIPKRILLHQLVPPYIGIVIENEHIIRMHREMYEIMWTALPD